MHLSVRQWKFLINGIKKLATGLTQLQITNRSIILQYHLIIHRSTRYMPAIQIITNVYKIYNKLKYAKCFGATPSSAKPFLEKIDIINLPYLFYFNDLPKE